MTKYLFIDGGFVDAMVEKTVRKFKLKPDNLDYQSMTKNFQRTFYYDCLPSKKTNETDEIYNSKLEAKRKLFEKINRTPYVHTREGLARNRLNRPTLEQKGVDILLAIDVFKHASLGNIQEAHIMTTDLDFFPLFEALRDTPVTVHLHCYREETSQELMALADVVRAITYFDVLRWLRQTDLLNTLVISSQATLALVDDHGVLVKEGLCDNLPFLIYEIPDFEEMKFFGRCMAINPHNLWQSNEWELIVAYLETYYGKLVYF